MSATEAASAGGDHPERPPAIPEEAWESIPAGLRRAFVEEAATWLVRGKHPLDALAGFAARHGLEAAVPSPPSGPPAPGRVPASRRPPPTPPPVLPRRPPPAPKPAEGKARSPRTVIGAAIQKASGISARNAADLEDSVLEAIAADPAMAYWDPVSVRHRGGRVTARVAEDISDLVRAEASKVVDGLRAAAAVGDAAASGWDDPDGWECSRSAEP